MRKKSLTISTHNISIIEKKKEGTDAREEIEVETLDVDSGSENSEDEVLEDEELLEDEYSGTEEDIWTDILKNRLTDRGTGTGGRRTS